MVLLWSYLKTCHKPPPGSHDFPLKILAHPGESHLPFQPFGNTARLLSSYNIQKAILSAIGITGETGAINSSPEETCIKEMAVKKSMEKYLLADSSKFSSVSLPTYCNVKDLTGIITDQKPDSDFCDYAAKHQVSLIIAG